MLNVSIKGLAEREFFHGFSEVIKHLGFVVEMSNTTEDVIVGFATSVLLLLESWRNRNFTTYSLTLSGDVMKWILAMTVEMLTSSVGAAEVGSPEAMVTEKRAKAAVIEHSTEDMGTISYR